jgi:hypothetical protein
MPSLKDLGLTNEVVGGDVDFDNLPKVGGFTPLLQPGKYTFQLPAAAALGQAFDVVDSKQGKRLQVIFDSSAPLLVVASPTNARNGEPFQQRISNVERGRGKDKILVSDLDYLLRALGHKSKPKTNPEYAQAILSHAGEKFQGTIEVQYSCNANKNIWVDDGTGNATEVEGKPGCGARYYQKDVADQKDSNGMFPERITCGGENCGASLRAFAQLSVFEPAPAV